LTILAIYFGSKQQFLHCEIDWRINSMNIPKIKDGDLNPVNINVLKKDLIKEQAKVIAEAPMKTPQEKSLNELEALLDTIGRLENNIQYDEAHPLDFAASAPIETFEEALAELKFIRGDKFKEEAYLAQANIKHDDVVSLFVDEVL
jgi:hypothetical protein